MLMCLLPSLGTLASRQKFTWQASESKELKPVKPFVWEKKVSIFCSCFNFSSLINLLVNSLSLSFIKCYILVSFFPLQSSAQQRGIIF